MPWTRPSADIGARFVLLVGAVVLALGGLVSHFPAPEATDLDLARAARAPKGRRGTARR
ncbi:hypothetical protein [Streptomyces monashensis]|uniref:hypothetical protein n=1 Tax=Streptomyces monashensis TaxID=1678012 RepID=UPI0015A5DA13|nr:hypothetical protein [Streptomyces monashensis]